LGTLSIKGSIRRLYSSFEEKKFLKKVRLMIKESQSGCECSYLTLEATGVSGSSILAQAKQATLLCELAESRI